MTDLDQARAQLRDIIAWWDVLGDVAETATGILGHGMSLAGTHTGPGDATMTAVLQIDAVDQIRRDLQVLAQKLGWRKRLDGDPKIFVLGHLDWAALNLAPVEWAGLISDVHRRVGSMTGHAPRRTARQCPMCGHELQLIPPDRPRWHTAQEHRDSAPDQFHCDGCQETRTSDELETILRWRLSQATHAPVPLAAKLLGIPANTIRKWISRGHLTRDQQGHINLHDTRQLATRQPKRNVSH